MILPRLTVVITLSLVLAFSIGCKNGDEAAGRTDSPVPASSGTDETPASDPTPTPVNEPAPSPPAPELGEDQTKLAEGTLVSTLLASGVASYDPTVFPLDGGATPPPCAGFVYLFNWQVTEPYPADSVALVWRTTRMDSTQEVGRGASGSATAGCGILEAKNDGGDRITVAVHYIIATTGE